MTDARATGATGTLTESELNSQITRSLGTIWHHHAGGRPGSMTVEITGDRVRCRRTEASARETEAAAEADAAGRSTTSASYRNDAMAAVKRLTRRRVVGFVAKSDTKSDVATETFILESPLRKH